MTLETALSIALLGMFIWAVRVRLPKAVQEDDLLALTSALLTAALALLGWLLTGIGTKS